MWPSLTLLCSTAVLFCNNIKASNDTIRLTDGPVSYAGRVELYYRGTWGSLCDDGLTLNEGHVICRQLGYSEAIAVPCCSAFGSGDGPFWLDGVQCKGNESSLADCEHNNWGETDCAHNLLNDDASVVCKPTNLSISYPLETRLSYAPVPYAGCVEVNYAGIWGDVWQFQWTLQDGRVVCRQLGYPDVVTVLWRCSSQLAYKYNVVTWMNDVRCLGNESSLSDCAHEQETYSSSYGYDAGVVCDTGNKTDLKIRLTGAAVPYSGRLEVLLAGIWGAIDSYRWGLEDAHVACRQLGFPGAETAVRGASFIFGSRSNLFGWMEDVNCLGNESSLSECPHSVSFTPGPVIDAGVVCKTNNSVTSIRLAGGNTSLAGRVEVWYAGMWGTVRNTGWDLNASDVACRQLGYKGAEAAILFAEGPFGKGQGPVWLWDLRCEGHEPTLFDCSWPRVTMIYWDHDHDAGVVCSANSLPSSKSNIRNVLDIVLPVTAGVVLLILLVIIYFRCCRGERGEYDPRRELMHMSEVSIGAINAGASVDEFQSSRKEDWCEISRGQLSLGEKVGTDLGGVTFHGRVVVGNGNLQDCIVKATRGERGPLEGEHDLLSELRIMGCLGSHPNILNLIGACTIRGPTYLIFEDAEYGNLLDYLKRNQVADSADSSQKICSLHKVEKLRIALDVTRGMKYIAEKKCIHRDLAARNVRLGKNGVAKLANIGSSSDIYDRQFFENISAGKLSAKWMAPESLESMNFSTESDVWSFGTVLWEIETGGDVPYPDIEAEHLLDRLKSGFRMKQPAKCSQIIYDVMTKCWHISPNDRPTFSELCIVLDTLVARQTTC